MPPVVMNRHDVGRTALSAGGCRRSVVSMGLRASIASSWRGFGASPCPCPATPATPSASPSSRCQPTPLRAAPGEEGPSISASAVAAEVVEGPWSRDLILDLVRQEEQQEEALQSEELTREFREDPQGLYEYVQRAYEEGPRHVASPYTLLMEESTGVPTIAYPAAVANDIIGIGSWRLKAMFDPVIEFLVARIEGCWRELLDTDLNLYPVDQWKAHGWDLVDSEDPQRQLDGFSYADIPDPAEGAEGYPRLHMENRVYCSRAFRKLHVEVAVRQDGMQVLHVVVYPRYTYDLPIFGLDLVLKDGHVSLAVVDCCPLRSDLKLPPHYMETMALLQRTFLADQDPTARRVPAWGAATFSPLALCISPSSPEELAGFVKYAVALHRAHLTMALRAGPVVAGPGDRRTEARLEEMLEGQKRFCENQLANKKTRRVLEAAFGPEWTDAYMKKLMFDFDPSYDPPFFDAEFEKLYTYFDENPEFGSLADEAEELELQAESERAAETLEAAANGRQVSKEKLDLAVKFLYQSDPKFRAAVQTLTGDQAEVPPEELLSSELMQLLPSSNSELEEDER
ncbi:hypothetical protein Agub_g15309 [Astrephomene gubernaculifera]|uniref:Phycocyanobilin:ferredoxin oxidoreductase n=1 Tax=Astrephomene gubernaculifera TaxID=47775 RepID=A0AAD3HTL6_9CHLO|nr:hypothetical protein Agub_g15309 [Astrephomene gubernaculifera]